MGASSKQHSASEVSPETLQELSDEVNRIAGTLARLAIAPATKASAAEEASAAGRVRGSVSIERVRQAIRERRLRSHYFDGELFADAAWDMLLDLYHSELSQFRVPVSSLCIASGVPSTTAIRWINTMSDAGLFRRRPDTHDKRRVFIELSPHASQAMRRYFLELEKPLSA